MINGVSSRNWKNKHNLFTFETKILSINFVTGLRMIDSNVLGTHELNDLLTVYVFSAIW